MAHRKKTDPKPLDPLGPWPKAAELEVSRLTGEITKREREIKELKKLLVETATELLDLHEAYTTYRSDSDSEPNASGQDSVHRRLYVQVKHAFSFLDEHPEKLGLERPMPWDEPTHEGV